jgi:hypothetical protein
MRRMLLAVQLLACCLLFGQHTAQATEGAQSYYFPGSATNFTTAVAPAPGFLFVNQMLFYSGKADTAVLKGSVHVDLKAQALYNYIGGLYTFKQPVLGSRLQIGAVVPVGHADVQAHIGHLGFADNRTDIGDTAFTAALYWKKGDVHYKLIETVYAPTGGYQQGRLANVGRNYWGFDTSLAVTWLDPKKGRELTITPGILFNTRNTATDYKSGNEFHVDLALNQYLSHHFAVGLHGYYYRQVTGDSGSGAKLGAFTGRSLGIGPAVLWTPKSKKGGQGDLVVMAKWLHDVQDHNRMQGHFGVLTVAYKF